MINGKVAKILDEYQVILNVGLNQGVEPGMVFVIYEQGEVVKDPETKEPLENLEIVKGEVEVIHVQQSICLARSKKIERSDKPTVLSAKLAEVLPSIKNKLEDTYHKLYVKNSDISTPRSAGPIVVGDFVRVVEPLKK